jgi:hypothetical protein
MTDAGVSGEGTQSASFAAKQRCNEQRNQPTLGHV